MTAKPLFQPSRVSGQDRPKPGTSFTPPIQEAEIISTSIAAPIIAETSSSVQVFKPVSVKALADAGISSPRVANLLVSFNSPTAILEYGQDIMTEISAKSDKFLAEVKDADVAFVETQLMSIISMAQKFHITPAGKQGGNIFSGLISKVKETFVDAKEVMLNEFNDVSAQMDRVIGEVDTANARITVKLEGLQVLYRENLNEYKKLDSLIKDAKEVFKIKTAEVVAMQEAATDMLAAEEVSRMNRILDRLDKKINNLEKFQLMAIQNAPSISQMEDSALTLLEKFHDIKTMTIPLWKKQIRLYIDSQELQRGAKLANAVNDANNSLIRANSDSISAGAIETATLNQRAVIDDETAQHVHDNLINTLNEVLKINQTGKQTRIESAEKMDEMKRLYAQIAAGKNPATTTE